jgi:hypothetical protein
MAHAQDRAGLSGGTSGLAQPVMKWKAAAAVVLGVMSSCAHAGRYKLGSITLMLFSDAHLRTLTHIMLQQQS